MGSGKEPPQFLEKVSTSITGVPRGKGAMPGRRGTDGVVGGRLAEGRPKESPMQTSYQNWKE
ncbi:UNVERIFIED_CONTAM: hypothetical protein Slati_2167700 [Sesamum latifolium]|uniref:Uncharacterized protein n=1 Tax=Sesamum latifolium TaxID=2727402 RepID=A0AAW2WWH6_9LAMI